MEDFYGFDLEWHKIDNRTDVELPANLFSHYWVKFSKDNHSFETEISLPIKIEHPSRQQVISMILLEIAASKLDQTTYDNAFQNSPAEACHLWSKEHTAVRYQRLTLEKILGRSLFLSTFFPKELPYTEKTLH